MFEDHLGIVRADCVKGIYESYVGSVPLQDMLGYIVLIDALHLRSRTGGMKKL